MDFMSIYFNNVYLNDIYSKVKRQIDILVKYKVLVFREYCFVDCKG